MLRYVRITVTIVSLIACMLLIVLWVRSYTWQETISGNGRGAFAVSTLRGSVFINEGFNVTIDSLDTIYYTRKPFAGGRVWISSQADIGYKPRGIGTKIPMWLFVAAVVVVAAAPCFPWSNRFSLRTLFIVTTIFAALLGLIVWLI